MSKIIFISPSIRVLNMFEYLVDKKIFECKNLEIICIYSENEKFILSTANIQKNFKLKIKVEIFKYQFDLNNIFEENESSVLLKNLFGETQGIIFWGGDDIYPKIFNQNTHLLSNVTDINKSFFEVWVAFQLIGSSRNRNHIPFLEFNKKYLVLGICLGMQILNVASGGTIVQDIPSQIYKTEDVESIMEMENDKIHKNYFTNINNSQQVTSGWLHRIVLENSVLLNKITADNITICPQIYSSHHQAIDRIGEDFTATAFSTDGKIVEAMEHKKYENVFAFQFHPEKSEIFDSEMQFYITNLEKMESYNSLFTETDLNFHYSIWKYVSGCL